MNKRTLLKKLTIGVASLALICPLALGGVSQNASARRRPRTHRVSNYGLSTGAAKRAVKKAYNRRTFVVPSLRVVSHYGNSVILKAHFGAEANIFFHVTKSGNQAHIHTAIKTNTGWASRSYYRTYGIRRNAKAQLYRAHQARRVYKPRRTVKRHARVRRHAKRYSYKRNSKRANNKKRVVKRNNKARKHMKRNNRHHESASFKNAVVEAKISQLKHIAKVEKAEKASEQHKSQSQPSNGFEANYYARHAKQYYFSHINTNDNFKDGAYDAGTGYLHPIKASNDPGYAPGWIINRQAICGNNLGENPFSKKPSVYQKAFNDLKSGIEYASANNDMNGTLQDASGSKFNGNYNENLLGHAVWQKSLDNGNPLN